MVRGPRTQCAGRFDVRLFTGRQHAAANDPEVLRHIDDRDRDGRGQHAAADTILQQERDDDGEQQVGEREECVHDEHQNPVEPAAVVTRNHAQRYADHQAERHGQYDDLDRGARPVDDHRHDVDRANVGSEPVRTAGRTLLGEAHAVREVLIEAVWRDQWREYREHDKHCGDPRAHPQQPLREALRLLDLLPQPEQRAARTPSWRRRGVEHRPTTGLGDTRGRHQYRTLGSMAAFTKSISKLIKTTARAKIVMMPWTAV